MKNLQFCLILILLTAAISCKNNDPKPATNLSVEQYVELLKAGQYNELTLPEFTEQDIPALLTYRNEKQLITNFPCNLISSFYGKNCPLGMYALWTIESIRAVATDNKFLIARFPSQNPILTPRNSAELNLIYADDSQQAAAKAYFDWWESNKQKNFDDFKNTDPLTTTNYRWH